MTVASSLPVPSFFEQVLTRGPAPLEAAATLVMIHGRGASAESILELHRVFGIALLSALAPQAPGGTWYPKSFLAPLAENQPYVDQALAALEQFVSALIAHGVESSRIALLGFSQGACLSSEFVARHPRRYGAIMLLSGGLIGPPGTPRRYSGSLDGVPVFLGAADPDPHVPFARVRETQAVLSAMGASAELRRYPGMPHTITQDECDACRVMLEALVSQR